MIRNGTRADAKNVKIIQPCIIGEGHKMKQKCLSPCQVHVG